MAFIVSVKVPVAGPWMSGVRVNAAAGVAATTTTAWVVDDIYSAAADARDIFTVGLEVWAKNTSKPSSPIEKLGLVSAVTATSIRCQVTGTAFAIADNAELYTQNPGGVALAKGKDSGQSVSGAATNALEITEDGRGNLLYTFFDLS
tara:strand:+ start:52 stop:492 length:441 start_codon:yes stop_codon:yes gene_type:complete